MTQHIRHTGEHLAHFSYFPPHYGTRKNLTELGKYSRELKYRRKYKFLIHSFRTDRSSKMFQVCPIFQLVHGVNLQREKYSCLGTAVFFSLTQWRYHYKMCLKLEICSTVLPSSCQTLCQLFLKDCGAISMEYISKL